MSMSASPKKSIFSKLFSKTRKNRMGNARSIYTQALAYYNDILSMSNEDMEDAVQSDLLSVKQLEEDYDEFIKPVFKELLQRGYNTSDEEYKSLHSLKYDATLKVKSAAKKVGLKKEKELEAEDKKKTAKMVSQLRGRLNALRGGGQRRRLRQRITRRVRKNKA